MVLAETVAGLADKYPDLKVHQVLETHMRPAEALLAAAATARLLVVGSKGRGVSSAFYWDPQHTQCLANCHAR